jgi:ribosomal protein S18 acetylase RimI-like enzyme
MLRTRKLFDGRSNPGGRRRLPGAVLSRCLSLEATRKTTLEIREYKPSDFKRLYEIDHQAFNEDIAYSRLELQFYVRSSGCRTLVADDAGEIVGFVIGCSEPRKLGHIITIDVVPHRQCQQIGSRLLAAIETWLWRQGAEALYLETPVDDHGARGFYDKHGYFVFERFEGYYNGTLDAFVMMKTSGSNSVTPASG